MTYTRLPKVTTEYVTGWLQIPNITLRVTGKITNCIASCSQQTSAFILQNKHINIHMCTCTYKICICIYVYIHKHLSTKFSLRGSVLFKKQPICDLGFDCIVENDFI